MAVDTPAKIAVLGAGPMGLEAALYGRFLGYDVEIFDRGEVAENVRRWGHVRMFSPFRMNASPLGLAALSAQDDAYRAPDPEQILTGTEWRERYLLPLSHSDLLVDHLRLQTTVVAVSRWNLLKAESIGAEERGEIPFRIVLRERDGREWETNADLVIDTTGVYGNANWIGAGGAPALGERDLRDRLEYGVPDVLGADQARFANKQVLLIGSGHSAATSALALRELSRSATATRVTWVTRQVPADGSSGPLRIVTDDALPERRQLVMQANELARHSDGVMTYWPGTMVARVGWDEARGLFDVEFRGDHAGTAAFDEIIANVGYRPDNRLSDELQVHWCYATNGPMKFAAQLLAQQTEDCLQVASTGADSLRTTEPDFYVLGAKSYGRHPHFLFAHGLQQIRELFTMVGDRENLDLYAGAGGLSS